MTKKHREQEEKNEVESYRKVRLLRLVKNEEELQEKFPGYENYRFIYECDDVTDPCELNDNDDYNFAENPEYDTPRAIKKTNDDDRACDNCENCLKNAIIYRECANVLHAGETVCGVHAESIHFPERTFCNFYSPTEEPCLSQKE